MRGSLREIKDNYSNKIDVVNAKNCIRNLELNHLILNVTIYTRMANTAFFLIRCLSELLKKDPPALRSTAS